MFIIPATWSRAETLRVAGGHGPLPRMPSLPGHERKLRLGGLESGALQDRSLGMLPSRVEHHVGPWAPPAGNLESST